MRKTRTQIPLELMLGVRLISALVLCFASSISAQQLPPVPNLHGTWELLIVSDDTDWNGNSYTYRATARVHIYQLSTEYHQGTPNIQAVVEGDEDRPLDGFVLGNNLVLYGSRDEPGNVGRDVFVGKVAKDGTELQGTNTGFDSNFGGGTWVSLRFKLTKVSASIIPWN